MKAPHSGLDRPQAQIPWVDRRLHQWGQWVRSEREIAGSVGSWLGRAHKARMKELGVWESSTAHYRFEPCNDDQALEVELALARLPTHLARLVKYRYWFLATIPSIAQRMHRSTTTIDRWIVQAQSVISEFLTP